MKHSITKHSPILPSPLACYWHSFTIQPLIDCSCGRLLLFSGTITLQCYILHSGCFLCARPVLRACGLNVRMVSAIWFNWIKRQLKLFTVSWYMWQQTYIFIAKAQREPSLYNFPAREEVLLGSLAMGRSENGAEQRNSILENIIGRQARVSIWITISTIHCSCIGNSQLPRGFHACSIILFLNKN